MLETMMKCSSMLKHVEANLFAVKVSSLRCRRFFEDFICSRLYSSESKCPQSVPRYVNLIPRISTRWAPGSKSKWPQVAKNHSACSKPHGKSVKTGPQMSQCKQQNAMGTALAKQPFLQWFTCLWEWNLVLTDSKWWLFTFEIILIMHHFIPMWSHVS